MANPERIAPRITLRQRLEYGIVLVLVAVLGGVPRRVARFAGARIGYLAWALLGKMRRTGLRNLELALPEQTPAEHRRILREMYRMLGWQMAEFCRMGRYSVEQASRLVRYEGLEHFEAAKARGQGVFVLTGHLGAWELSSFYHSMMGSPMALVIRRLDNPLVDRFVNGIRCRHGNRVIHKDEFARGLLTAMHRGDTVGILMDTNMTPPQGVFVPFFGIAACTATGLAKVVAKCAATVLPGFLLWEAAEGRYVLHFGEALPVVRGGEAAQDILANTAMFNAAIESYIRRYPEQWLWLHRRWKTRPAGEESLYA